MNEAGPPPGPAQRLHKQMEVIFQPLRDDLNKIAEEVAQVFGVTRGEVPLLLGTFGRHDLRDARAAVVGIALERLPVFVATLAHLMRVGEKQIWRRLKQAREGDATFAARLAKVRAQLEGKLSGPARTKPRRTRKDKAA